MSLGTAGTASPRRSYRRPARSFGDSNSPPPTRTLEAVKLSLPTPLRSQPVQILRSTTLLVDWYGLSSERSRLPGRRKSFGTDVTQVVVGLPPVSISIGLRLAAGTASARWCCCSGSLRRGRANKTCRGSVVAPSELRARAISDAECRESPPSGPVRKLGNLGREMRLEPPVTRRRNAHRANSISTSAAGSTISNRRGRYHGRVRHDSGYLDRLLAVAPAGARKAR